MTRCADPVSTACLAQIEPTNGELWERLAFTYLLSDDLQNAYTAYQHALFHLPNPKDTQVRRGLLQPVRLARGQPPCTLHRTDTLPGRCGTALACFMSAAVHLSTHKKRSRGC